ncbi:TetR/AcrR family transcriptional regulator [Streptomyces sp. Li-HN-5-11]|uniref:TetR/AcrR family transcriptional regulator n=1 Tax=Streptomyces sp. Li-HN-5-11 TaxID=3075432 RepID=UPI0028ACF96C|nr:TetR/AcrR family transcriptional regulator [Streptomyces sp. Li-HN-5-11]WNM31884.1 TetR/AcrR family transcriptional regulator [Streptomyces sp. Li-HN-5-11]
MASARREEILESALETFAERGFKNTSIDAVAERAGLTRQGVLHYFPSKKRLLLEVLNLREQLARANLADRPAGEDWAADFAETVAFDQEHPSFATVQSVVMAEAVTGQEPARGYVRDRYRSLQRHLADRLVERYGERLPSGLSAPDAAVALLALIEGVHQLWPMDQEPDTDRYPRIVRETLTVLLGTGGEDADGADTDGADTGSRPHDPAVKG